MNLTLESSVRAAIRSALASGNNAIAPVLTRGVERASVQGPTNTLVERALCVEMAAAMVREHPELTVALCNGVPQHLLDAAADCIDAALKHGRCHRELDALRDSLTALAGRYRGLHPSRSEYERWRAL